MVKDYYNKTHFKITMFGKQMVHMHAVAAVNSKVFKWDDYEKWMPLNHKINGTVLSEQNQSTDALSLVYTNTKKKSSNIPPINLQALAKRQEFVTMILACLGVEGRICYIKQFKNLYKALDYELGEDYIYGKGEEKRCLDTDIYDTMLFKAGAKDRLCDHFRLQHLKEEDIEHLVTIFLYSHHDNFEDFDEIATILVLRSSGVTLVNAEAAARENASFI
uniref:Uncharacterized protein n=1 Tax=Panagrolaimus davidi TaxID=227884 RepID=A0A914QBT7_9BILA